MASIRCEHLTFDFTVKSDGYLDPTKNTLISRIGAVNTTTSLTGSSAIVYGPVTSPITVVVRAFGGQAYVTKGASPTVTAANSTLIDTGNYVVLRLEAGDSIAAMTASVS